LNLLILSMRNLYICTLCPTMFALFVSVGFFLISNSASAQRNVRDSVVFSPHISFNYGLQLPAADMEQRFGVNSAVGLAFHLKTKKNWIFGAEWSYLFGKQVNEEGLMQNLTTDGGFIINNEGGLAKVLILERGSITTVNVGKILSLKNSNPNSGIMIKGGVGLMQHKIRLETQEDLVTQLEGEYIKGYDRLTNGIVFSQFLGYFHMSDNKLSNFYAGFEFYEGFTRGRRELNFDTQVKDNAPRTDILYGFKVGWVIHMYKRTGREFYYD
jgi:hypothetical protein